MILDEVDPTIRANLESRGWLSLLEIDHPPPTALIREFFSNLSCHVYDSNTLVRSWVRSVEFTITPRLGVEFTITPRVVVEAFGVPVITDLVYPYDESHFIDVVMSHITRSFILSTPSLLSDVCFYTLSCLVHLSAFLTCFFVL